MLLTGAPELIARSVSDYIAIAQACAPLPLLPLSDSTRLVRGLKLQLKSFVIISLDFSNEFPPFPGDSCRRVRRKEDGYELVRCVGVSTSLGPLRHFLTFRDMRAIMSDCCIMPGTHMKLLQVLLEVVVSEAQVVRIEVAGLVMVGIKVDVRSSIPSSAVPDVFLVAFSFLQLSPCNHCLILSSVKHIKT